jgi:hypothetical protein
MTTTAIVSMVVIGALMGFVVGWVCGETQGRDAQWCDSYFEHICLERARRNRLGQFKKKETT